MATPDLVSLKAFLGVQDTQDDPALQEALDAALAAQAVVVRYPTDAFGAPVFTDDLVLAVHLRAQRYIARRNSPEGVVGLSGLGGDFVGARVSSYDNDVFALEGPYRTIPVG